MIWLRKSATDGNRLAQYNLALVLLGAIDHQGEVNVPDNAEARYWLEKAGRSGYRPAIEKLEEIDANVKAQK